MSKQLKITSFFTTSADNRSHTSTSDPQLSVKPDKQINKRVINSAKSDTKNGFKNGFKNGLKRKWTSNDLQVVTTNGAYSGDNRRPKFARNNGPKTCPFYKRIPNTGFVVDAFSYGSIGGVSVYFLTHFHSDHYVGLKNSFSHQIYCSPITASLLRHHFKSAVFSVNVIEINETQEVLGTRVTFFEANHCPGAVVILFELTNGCRYLHTGDFRANHSFFEYPKLMSRPIDTIFLDTTYCDPKYDFLPQNQILKTIVSIASEHYHKNSKLLIVCGTYTIGKENVFISIANALKLKVWTNVKKQQIYKCYKSSQMDSLLVPYRHQSKLHVLTMDCINETFLEKYIQEFEGLYDEVLAFRPTGWEHNKNSKNGVRARRYRNITIYGIEYSEHSSYTELQRFISFFKPKRVIPTVNNTNQLSRNKMDLLFKQWINSSEDSSEIQEIPRKSQINGSLNSWISKSGDCSQDNQNTDEITIV